MSFNSTSHLIYSACREYFEHHVQCIIASFQELECAKISYRRPPMSSNSQSARISVIQVQFYNEAASGMSTGE